MYVDEDQLVALLKKHNIPHTRIGESVDRLLLVSFDGTGKIETADTLLLHYRDI